MDYALAFEKLGRKGARNASTWEMAVATWIDDGKGPMPSVGECHELIREADKQQRKDKIKAEAGRIIEARYPLTTQLNMLARYSELCGRFVILPYTAEAEEKAKLEAAYDWIKAVRVESNRLESDATATANWPE
jgi:hypothetical protein